MGEVQEMPIAFALLLTLAYAALAPLGHRIRAAEARALGAGLPGVPSSASVAAARSLLARGWTSLVASELWLLLLLAALVAIFQAWWLALVLPVAGVGLRVLLHEVDPYPAHLAWYLARFRVQVERALTRAVAEGDGEAEARARALAAALDELAADEGEEPVLS